MRRATAEQPAVALRASLVCPWPELRDATRSLIRRAIKAPTLAEAAATLGVGRRTLERIIMEFPMDFPRDRRLPSDTIDLSAEQIEKFWRRVDVRGPDECWPWRTAKPGEYGIFSLNGGGMRIASRVALQISIGPLPSDILACHRCDNPPCCNPAHLFPGTHEQNMQDMVSKGRAKRKHKRHPVAALGDTQEQNPEPRQENAQNDKAVLRSATDHRTPFFTGEPVARTSAPGGTDHPSCAPES